MDKNNSEKKKTKSKNELDILKSKKEDITIGDSTDMTQQKIIQDIIQKNDITLALNKTIIKKKPHYYNKGKVHMFLFCKNGSPIIVIGPHCKKKIDN
jgi:hypothetical protein